MEYDLKFKIDEKSLFFGVYNDYNRGQTATVSTPLNQSKDKKKWRLDILELREYDCRIENPPEMLVYQCQKSSKSGNSIDDIFLFDNIFIDGLKLNTDKQFAMYIKRETDKIITRANGTKGENTHYGRMKLHYPISMRFKSDGYKIDNLGILNTILKQNGGFAFVVRGFEYNQKDKSLNFITSLIGPEGVPLSTVFKRAKGVGKKLMIDPNKIVDNDYVVIVEQNPETKSNNITYELINKSRAENGKLGEEFIYQVLSKELEQQNELYHTSKDYPQSPYDMEYVVDGKKYYVEVKSTSGTKKVFNMSSGEIKFMEKYKDRYILFMVTEVKEVFPKYYKYCYEDIMNMRKEYPTTRFYA